MTKTPIFLVSQPRAGSTMTQLVLSNSNQVSTASEPWIQFFLAGLEKSLARKALNNRDRSFKALFEFLQPKPEEHRKQLLRNITDLLYDDGSLAKYFLDKTPRYYLFLDELKAVFPQAKFIILKRDPEAVFHSIVNTWHAESSVRKITKVHYEDLFVAPKLLQDFLDKHSTCKNVYSLQYEATVNDPINTFQNLYSFLNLDFKPELLNYSRNKKLQGTLGDPTGIQRSSTPQKGTQQTNLKRNHAKMLDVYLASLGHDFLDQYGYKNKHYKNRKKLSNKINSYGKSSTSRNDLKSEIFATIKYYCS